MNTILNILIEELKDSSYSLLVASQDYEAIAHQLNQIPMIPNPNPQQQVPHILSIEEALVLVSPTEAFAIAETKTFDYITDGINRRYKEQVVINLQILVAGNVLSQSSLDLLMQELDKTDPDPNYQSLIPGVSRAKELNIYPVSSSMIQEALTNGL